MDKPININTATNNELREALENLTRDFEDEKKIIAKAYARMNSISEQAVIIKGMLDKRNGGANG